MLLLKLRRPSASFKIERYTEIILKHETKYWDREGVPQGLFCNYKFVSQSGSKPEASTDLQLTGSKCRDSHAVYNLLKNISKIDRKSPA